MNGTNALTGQILSGIDHLRQSITDILTTPLGSRVMRRDYGSRLFELIDAPMNRGTLADIYAATVEALAKWEPRIQVTQVKASSAEPGRVTLDVTGNYLPSGKAITLQGIIVQ
jgi:phage baseplate assembly protein W